MVARHADAGEECRRLEGVLNALAETAETMVQAEP